MRLFIFALLFILSASANAQSDEYLKKGPVSAANEKEYEEQYKKNIRKSKLNGVYIPINLNDAFRELVALSPEESIIKFKNAPEKEVVKKLHHGLGKWMISKWGFYTGSRISHKLKGMGLTYPDDMAQFMLRAFHRHLNELPIEKKKLAAEYIDMRKTEHDDRVKERKILKTEVKKIPKN